MGRLSTAVIAFLIIGCHKPVEAPAELDELMGWMFEHIGDEDDEALEAGVSSMNEWMDVHPDETFDEGYSVKGLASEMVLSLEGEERDLTSLVGVAVGYEQELSVADLVVNVMVDPTETRPGTYKSYEYVDLEASAECLTAADCERLTREVWLSQSFPLGLEVETHSMNQYRWFDTEHGPAFVYRNWTREQPTSNKENLLDIQQAYFMWMFFPTESGARSMQTSWVVVDVLGGSIDANSVLGIWVNSMKSNAEQLDGFEHE